MILVFVDLSTDLKFDRCFLLPFRATWVSILVFAAFHYSQKRGLPFYDLRAFRETGRSERCAFRVQNSRFSLKGVICMVWRSGYGLPWVYSARPWDSHRLRFLVSWNFRGTSLPMVMPRDSYGTLVGILRRWVQWNSDGVSEKRNAMRHPIFLDIPCLVLLWQLGFQAKVTQEKTCWGQIIGAHPADARRSENSRARFISLGRLRRVGT